MGTLSMIASLVIPFLTFPVPTAAPQFFEAVAVSSGSIRMSWIPPPEEEQNGVIRSYHICVTEILTETV